ncbi:MAG TPA: GMP/IMP nucleotidase [Gammaproteobacteria bacterium]|nr:GMP/IMP nucleotidase [Gammaproteobacteria bacterium]
MTIDADGKNISNKCPLWQDIDTVLLDMDGTLLDLHFDNYFWMQHVPECYAEKHGVSHDVAYRHVMQRSEQTRSSLDWYCVDFWTRELSLDIGQLKHDMSEKIAIRPDVVSFLSWLNKKGKRVVLVTNAHPVSLDLKMEKTQLHVHFDNIVNAHDIGMAKEHEGFWDKLQAYEPYDMRRTMLIDDNMEVLGCAHEYGIKYCYGITQPDSRGRRVKDATFVTLDSFKEILP